MNFGMNGRYIWYIYSSMCNNYLGLSLLNTKMILQMCRNMLFNFHLSFSPRFLNFTSLLLSNPKFHQLTQIGYFKWSNGQIS